MKSNEYNKEKFFRKNLAAFLIPAVIPLLILGVFSILITQGYVKDEINQTSRAMLQQTSQKVDLILNNLDTLSLNFDTNPDLIVTLKNLLNKDQLSLAESRELTILKSFMKADADLKPYIHSTYAYYNNDQRKLFSTMLGLTNLNDSNDKDWYDSFDRNRKSTSMWSEIRNIQIYFFEESQQVLTVYKNLFSPGRKEADGVLVLNLKSDFLNQMLNSQLNYRDQSLIVLNEANKVIASSNLHNNIGLPEMDRIIQSADTFFTLKTPSDTYAAVKFKSETYGWSYISVIPQDTLYEVPRKLLLITFVLIVLSLVMSIVPSYFFTRKNGRNVKKIISILESAKQGEPVPSPVSKIKDEYSYIIQSIVKAFIEQNFLKTQLSERKYRMQVLELLALQSQMNPHFLFNTLHSINWKSIGLTGKPNEVSEMIESLATILEYSFREVSEMVTMEEEIKHTRNYLAIQSARYGDKFKVIWHCDEEVNQVPVMKLQLQPLIENSIYHGIREKDGKGIIGIYIHRKRQYLRILIIDNGLGIQPDKYKEIRSMLKTGDPSTNRHIGLLNTNKRLILTYGEEYRLKVRSEYGSGVIVLIRIPAILMR